MKYMLSIDGGGIKGVVSAYFFQYLEERLAFHSKNSNARIADYFDLIAGTSTGAILAGLFLCPNERGESRFSAKEITQMYLNLGKFIFKRQMLYPVYGAKFANNNLNSTLYEVFGEKRISTLRKPCLIVSYDMTTRKAVFFNSVTGRKDESRNVKISDAILASCAAPSVFPPVCIKSEGHCKSHCYIDGGVVANNPSFCAIVETMKLPNCKGISDVFTVSVGNLSDTTAYYYDKVRKWGIIPWASNIFSLFTDGSEQTVAYQLFRMYQAMNLSENYYRFVYRTDEELPKFYDSSDRAYTLFQNYAQRFVQKEKLRIDELAKRLCNK